MYCFSPKTTIESIRLRLNEYNYTTWAYEAIYKNSFTDRQKIRYIKIRQWFNINLFMQASRAFDDNPLGWRGMVSSTISFRGGGGGEVFGHPPPFDNKG